MQTQSFSVTGMSCASCVASIESVLKEVEGVSSVEVNFATEKVKISYDDSLLTPKQLSSYLEPMGYSLVIPTQQAGKIPETHNSPANTQLSDLKKKITVAIPIAIFSIILMFWEIAISYQLLPAMNSTLKHFFNQLLPLLATYILFVTGKPYLHGVYRFFRHGKANMDTLIGIGTSVAFLYSFIITTFEAPLQNVINTTHQYYDVTIVVITFIALGKYLELQSKQKTGDAIEKLLNLQAKTALIIKDGQETEIPIEQVKHDDLIIVKPGSKIPVDGIITEGSSYIDESMITGEPLPTFKTIESQVVAGTLNTTGSFTFKATKIGSETLLAQIITMVEDAQGSKAPIQTLADKISAVFVPIVLIIATLSLISWLTIGTKFLGFSEALSFGLVSFVGVLVIACPCALGLATPTAIIVGVGKGARNGILIKNAETLEKLHKTSTIVLDKTGTITQGKPTLTDFHNLTKSSSKTKLTDQQLLSILTSLEKNSEHPIAHAIIKYAEDNNLKNFQKVSNFQILQGKGLQGIIQNTKYFVGNLHFMQDLNLTLTPEQTTQITNFTKQGKTPVIIANSKQILGFAMISDPLKPNAKEAIDSLHNLGIQVAMVTGDTQETANYIANLVGIDTVIANVLPQDKLQEIQKLQKSNNIVAMVGDGINDAPALAQADIGIAMGTGTDIAIESAGITLLNGDISKLPQAIKLSQITIRGIKQNLFWAFIYNIVGIPLAAGLFYPLFGWILNPIFAGFAMAMSSVSVVSNSLRIKAKKL